MKLGELLVHSGVIDARQLDAALRHQVVYGGRLGTNLIELGHADVDQVSHGLARQHSVPAALTKHFHSANPAALRVVPRELAARHAMVPIAFAETRHGRRLVACFRAPENDKAIAAIAKAAGIEVLPSVAAELMIYYWLERAYNVPRQQRYKHVQPGRAAAPPEPEPSDVDIDIDEAEAEAEEPEAPPATEPDMPSELQLVAIDSDGVQTDFSQYSIVGGQRDSLIDLGRTTPPSGMPATTPPPAAPATAPHDEQPLTAAQAIQAIRAAPTREQVSDAELAFLRTGFAAGLILVVKGDIALGYRGFGGQFDDTTVESILVPLGVPSMFRLTAESRAIFRGAPPPEGKTLQDRFFKLFRLPAPPSEVAIAPVSVRDRVVTMIYAHGSGGGPLADRSVQELFAVSKEAGDAFVRLIAAAKRDG